MKSKVIELKEYKVLVVDAPIEATHSKVSIYDGLNYLICKKTKVIDLVCWDSSTSDAGLKEKYSGKFLLDVGKIETVANGVLDILFDVVKNGNFYEYSHNGVLYPSSKSALIDILLMESDFTNPFVLIIKPE